MQMAVPELTFKHALLACEVQDALPGGLPFFPIALVHVSRKEVVHFSVPVRPILIEVANVAVAIAEGVLAESLLHAVVPVTLVSLPVLSDMDPNTMLLAGFNFALVVAAAVFVNDLVEGTLHDLILDALEDCGKVLLHELRVAVHRAHQSRNVFHLVLRLLLVCRRCSLDLLLLDLL